MKNILVTLTLLALPALSGAGSEQSKAAKDARQLNKSFSASERNAKAAQPQQRASRENKMRNTVYIQRAAGVVSAEVQFGPATISTYKLWLYDSADSNPALLLTGDSVDDATDEAQVPGGAPGLIGRLVFLRARAASLSLDHAQVVSVTLRFKQGGVALGEITRTATIHPGQEARFPFAVRFQTKTVPDLDIGHF